MTNTWAEGLSPKFKSPDGVQARLLLAAGLCEGSEDPMDVDELKKLEDDFLIKILNTRIEVLKLPISFTPAAKLMIMGLVDRPGSIVALLIDCLNAYEGKKVTTGMLLELYPSGFYDSETLERYVEQFLKARKVKWAEIY